MIDKLYRYDGNTTWNGLICSEYKIVRKTKCGWWIKSDHYQYKFFKGDEKWVSSAARKRFAYPTKLEAARNLLLRRKKYIKILKVRILASESLIIYCEKLMKELNND